MTVMAATVTTDLMVKRGSGLECLRRERRKGGRDGRDGVKVREGGRVRRGEGKDGVEGCLDGRDGKGKERRVGKRDGDSRIE